MRGAALRAALTAGTLGTFGMLGVCGVPASLSGSPPARAAQPAAAACTLDRADYRGWNAYRLTNGLVTLYVVPEIGGRVIQYQLGAHPFFWVNPDLAGRVFPPDQNGGPNGGWKNYGGSKVWPAPQGWASDTAWAGPPDPVLDGGRYAAEVVARTPERVALRLTGPADPRTGVQFTRVISLERGSSRVRVEHEMRNAGRRPVRWAVWENAQLDAADPADPARPNADLWAYAPMNPRSVFPGGYGVTFGQAGHPSYQPDYRTGMFALHYAYRVGKAVLDSHAGWLASRDGARGYCYVQTFTPHPGEVYADNASVELWLNGAGEFLINGAPVVNAADPRQTPYVLESETLSPFAALAPGELYRYPVAWYAARCDGPVAEVNAAGLVTRPLTATRRGAEVVLDGSFGAFHRGRAVATVYARDGAVLGRTELGPAEPDAVLRVARTLAAPDRAFRVTIALLGVDGESRGTLAGAPIP